MNQVQRYRGALLGLAAGDALGTTLEFRAPGSFAPIDDMVGGGPFHLQPGQWTDDTSMALCLAASLVETGRFDPLRPDAALRATGTATAPGARPAAASTSATPPPRRCSALSAAAIPLPADSNPRSAGNGSLMRLAPVVLAFATEPARAIDRAGDSSRTTHAAPAAVDACRYFAGLLLGALDGVDRETLLAPAYAPLPDFWQTNPLVAEVAAVANGSFREKMPPALRGSGYVVAALEAALWAFHHSRDFRHGALLAANLGDDADTTAAIYGQLAGAYYGAAAIPAPWLARLALADDISRLAEQLYQLAHQPPAALDLASRLQVVDADITRLPVDVIVNAANSAAARRGRRGRRHPPRGGTAAPGSVPPAGRLSNRRGENHARLPPAGALRDSHRGPDLARRRPRRAGAAGLLLPAQPGAGGRPRRAQRGLPGHQHRRLRLPAAGRRADRRRHHRPVSGNGSLS